MEKNNTENKNKHPLGQIIAGAAFTIALIGICVLLFLLSDAGSDLVGKMGNEETM